MVFAMPAATNHWFYFIDLATTTLNALLARMGISYEKEIILGRADAGVRVCSFANISEKHAFHLVSFFLL